MKGEVKSLPFSFFDVIQEIVEENGHMNKL